MYTKSGEWNGQGVFHTDRRIGSGAGQAIIDEAGRFFRKWNPSHGIAPNDAILAATALVNGGQIHTLNKKHYPMKDIIVKKAW